MDKTYASSPAVGVNDTDVIIAHRPTDTDHTLYHYIIIRALKMTKKLAQSTALIQKKIFKKIKKGN